jgi:hypothetical protein
MAIEPSTSNALISSQNASSLLFPVSLGLSNFMPAAVEGYQIALVDLDRHGNELALDSPIDLPVTFDGIDIPSSKAMDRISMHSSVLRPSRRQLTGNKIIPHAAAMAALRKGGADPVSERAFRIRCADSEVIGTGREICRPGVGADSFPARIRTGVERGGRRAEPDMVLRCPRHFFPGEAYVRGSSRHAEIRRRIGI